MSACTEPFNPVAATAGPATAALPRPSESALAHSNALLSAIQDEMQLAPDGAIPFRRYMEMCLYHPGLGYYVAGSRKFGAEGDFITAPELGPVFARCLANQVAEILQDCAGDTLLEFGAGSGRLAVDLLNALDALGHAPARYLILEPSPELQQRQAELIVEQAPDWLERVEWLQGLPETPIRGCMVANEVLDAMPVVRFEFNGHEVVEQVVICGPSGFELATRPLAPAQQRPLDDLIASHGRDWPAGYRSELNPNLGGWFRSLAGALEAGAVLISDYGYPRGEYYLPERANGTLSCHYRHHTHTDPFLLPGLQDLTAHVDFTSVAEAADAAGLDVLGFTSQMAFLTGNGLEAIVNESDPEDTASHLRLSQQVKTLTMPGEMGEVFKVFAAGRDIDPDLRGFRFMDQRRRL